MNDIKSEIIKTKNIQESLENFAQENLTPLSECDFTIDNTSTFIKDSSDTSYRLFNEDIYEQYQDKEKILNERIEFEQQYTIRAHINTTQQISLEYSIDFAEYATHPKIVIFPNSKIPYKKYKAKEIFKMLIVEINRIKALNKIVINVFDEEMIKNLKVFTKYIYAGKFTKKVRIPLFNGIEPEISSSSKLINWYKEKETSNQVIEVAENEVLIEYKKPFYGKKGFNAYGKIIDTESLNNKDDLSLEVDKDTIEIIDKPTKKLYKSKIKGYVHIVNNTILIDNKIKLSKLSRNQNKLAEDEHNNIEVHISQSDTSKDSVGEGVELVSETIHISGHIGANSIIEATNLRIDGATHQDSTQFARFAKINRHKGMLRCHEATIALLEGGEVHATNVNIESSLGGVIYAQNVTIGHVKSNLKIYASDSINIRLVSGEDNLFKINYLDIPILISKLALIDDDILELKDQLIEASRHNLSEVDSIKEKIKQFRNTKDMITKSVFQAKISIEKPLQGLNNIIFTINKEDELIYKTTNQQYSPFYLEVTENSITMHPTDISISL